MTNKLANAIRMIAPLLASQTTSITGRDIDSHIDLYIRPLAVLPGHPLWGLDLNVLREHLLTYFNADISQAQILEGRERREPWLMEFKQNNENQWRFWEDYKKFLLEIKLCAAPFTFRSTGALFQYVFGCI